MVMLRMLIKSIILVTWTLSSFTNGESLQHHGEGTMLASRSSSYNNAVGKEFTCQYVSSRILTVAITRNRSKCHVACTQDSDCSGYHFDRVEGICTVYSVALQGSPTQHCVKTAVVLGTVNNFSCAPGDITPFTGVQNFRQCKRKCEQDKCYGFEYDSEERTCDIYMFGDASYGLRCDKKLSLVSSLKCPCFSNDEIENTTSELIRGATTANLEKASCQTTDEGSYGLYYMNNASLPADQRIFNSFSVGGRDANQVRTCTKDNNVKYIAEEEEDACLSQLQKSCNTLDSRKVSLDGTCPCYNKDDLNNAAASISNSFKKLRGGSCERSIGTSISFFFENTSNNAAVEGYSVYISPFSRKCTFGGDIRRANISAQSAVDCFRIIEDVCEQFKQY